jgi:hypothetical protein
VSKDDKPKKHTKDIDRLKIYYMDLFDIALDLFVYLGRRMQVKENQGEGRAQPSSEMALKLSLLKQDYAKDTFFREEFKNIADHAANKISRAIELIEAGNEPAANKCIFGIINRIFFLRNKFSGNRRHGYRKDNTFESDWDEFRQKAAVIDFEISDRRWVRKTHSVLKDISNAIHEKGYNLSEDDISGIRGAIDGLIDSSVKPGGELKDEDKVVSVKFLKSISLMLGIGSRHIRTVRIFIELACRHLMLRERENIGIIDTVGRIRDPDIRKALSLADSYHESHIDKISKRQDLRDKDIARQADAIIYYLLQNNIDKAKTALERLASENPLVVEPEYAGVDDIVDMVLQAIDSGDIKFAVYHVRRIKNIAKYAKDFRDMIIEYNQRVLEKEIISEQPVERIDILRNVYLDYLSRHSKVNASAKLSALYWAKLYQLANVPMLERLERTRIHNRLFEAISAYISLIKHDKIISVYGDKMLDIGSLVKTSELIRSIHIRRDHIIREDLPYIMRAIADDFQLSSEDVHNLTLCLWLQQRHPVGSALEGNSPVQKPSYTHNRIKGDSIFDNYRIYTNIKSAA